MNCLLDTNVISELIKPRPDGRVSDWLRGRPPQSLFLSVITLGEIEQGIAPKKTAEERQRLRVWREKSVLRFFSGRILPVDDEIASQSGRLMAENARRGLTPPVLDGYLAATALCHDLVVVARDAQHFEYAGVHVFNPWTDS